MERAWLHRRRRRRRPQPRHLPAPPRVVAQPHAHGAPRAARQLATFPEHGALAAARAQTRSRRRVGCHCGSALRSAKLSSQRPPTRGVARCATPGRHQTARLGAAIPVTGVSLCAAHASARVTRSKGPACWNTPRTAVPHRAHKREPRPARVCTNASNSQRRRVEQCGRNTVRAARFARSVLVTRGRVQSGGDGCPTSQAAVRWLPPGHSGLHRQ